MLFDFGKDGSHFSGIPSCSDLGVYSGCLISTPSDARNVGWSMSFGQERGGCYNNPPLCSWHSTNDGQFRADKGLDTVLPTDASELLIASGGGGTVGCNMQLHDGSGRTVAEFSQIQSGPNPERQSWSGHNCAHTPVRVPRVHHCSAFPSLRHDRHAWTQRYILHTPYRLGGGIHRCIILYQQSAD